MPTVSPLERGYSECNSASKLDQRQRGSALLSIASSARSVGAELGSLDLAAQHGELVAEHGDLDVLDVLDVLASQGFRAVGVSRRRGRTEPSAAYPVTRPCCSAHRPGL